jgi:hypothetical protein
MNSTSTTTKWAIPSQVLHDIASRSPSLHVTVGALKKIMGNPSPEAVWLELTPFYSGLTVSDVKSVWTAEPPARPKPVKWPLRLFTRSKSTLP